MSSSNPSSNDVAANNLLVSVGFGLLMIGIINILYIALTSKFRQDPVWEITTLGRLVGISPIPIIGISFIFYGESKWATLRLDKQVTRFFLLQNLSRLSLALSISYLSLLFMAVNSSKKIVDTTPSPTTNSALSQRSSQPLRENLTNDNDVNLLKRGSLVSLRSPTIYMDKSNVIDIRYQSVADSLKAQNDPQGIPQPIEVKDYNPLFEQMGKWYVEALVYTLVLFGIWYQTDWARNPSRPRRKRSSHNSANKINVDNKSEFDDLDN